MYMVSEMDQPKLDDFEGYRDTAGQSQKKFISFTK